MHNRFTRTTRDCARHVQKHSSSISTFARDTLSGFFTTAHHTLMVSGIAALCTLALMFYRPDMIQKLKSMSPFGAGATVGQTTEIQVGQVPMDTPRTPFGSRAYLLDTAGIEAQQNPSEPATSKATGTERQQQWVTNWLSKRYRVASDATDMLVSAAYTTAKDIKIDPLLILAVVAIESGFNPFAESAVGAQGLMQVMSKIHHEKFQNLGGVKAALNPVANIRVGSMILKDYVSRGGSLEAGLKMYVGAAAFDNDAGYGSKVLAEYNRLKAVATGKNVPTVTNPAPLVIRIAPKTTDVAEPKTPVNNGEQASASDRMHNAAGTDVVAAM
ncbi:transglycosylase SLT domain-containing protein [Actimicrobium antarcticum]|uniref:Transglycosylase SLT domain-containing protein n=1 Tax=Actimicrobium antarcticum TaxID=1051899 RepID=A0ABP7TUF8_9BURK